MIVKSEKRKLAFESLEQRRLLSASLPAIVVSDVVVSEAADNAVFVVSLSEPSNDTVTIRYGTHSETARSLDYRARHGTVSFAPGITQQTISVPIRNDDRVEDTEQFQLLLTRPVAATLTKSVGLATIADDDTTIVSLAPASLLGKANRTVTLKVRLTNASRLPVSVQLDTVDGTAKEGVNYRPIEDVVVTFRPGQLTKTVRLRLLDAGSADISFTVVASQLNGVGAILGVSETTIVLPGALVPGDPVIETVGGNQIVTPAELPGMLPNPDVGYQTFYTSVANDPNVAAAKVISQVYYTRLRWSDIETALGVYDWTVLDRELNAATQGGQKLAFRIMPFEEGDQGPRAYRDAGLPGFSFSVAGTNTWIPDYNHATVQWWTTKFITALGQRYGHDPAINSVDIGMVGRWGEMHYYECNPAPPLPTTATWAWLIDTFKANFSRPILINADPVLSNLEAFQYAISRGVGWRDDGWSENWEMNTLLPQALAAAPDAWKSTPIILESSGIMANTAAWRAALAWADANHVSLFNNKGAKIPTALLPAVQDLITRMGYRFVLTEARHAATVQADSSFQLRLDWTNKGNAPIYQDRNILVKIGDRVVDLGHTMKGFLPGSRTDVLDISTIGLSLGSHAIQIGLAAPGQTTPDIALAITGGVGKWYSVGTVTIVGP
jgi:hypothetical protein